VLDTDHPVTRDLWTSMLADTVPQFRGRRVSQGGYLLTNEPHWYTCTEGWATGPVSAKTKARFRNWLKERHGAIANLNSLWKTEFASFADVTITVPIDAKLRGQPVWYDWCRFNMDRITEWFGFLKQEIRRHDPSAPTHIKLIPGHLSRHSRCHGLDFEALVRLQDIIGCDASVVNVPHWKNEETWPERYACDWRGQALPLDFFRSISPGKLVFDSEWHGLSKSNVRNARMSGEYVRAALWLAHLHGTGMNQTWYWSRNPDGSLPERYSKAFYASNLAQPLVMDSYGRTMKELNAFSPEVVALAMQPKRARIFYSEASAIQDKAYMDHVYETYKALYHGGVPLGFVTGRLLAEAGAAEFAEWPLLVVPHADHVTAEDRRSLEMYLAQGGKLLVVGADGLKYDEYGRPFAPLQAETGKIQRIDQIDSTSALAALAEAGIAPPFMLKETNGVGLPGCVWRTAPSKDGHILLIINLGKTTASIKLGTSAPCRDLVTGAKQKPRFKMQPYDMRLLHVEGASVR
jgi:beta-galactosidase